MALVIKDRVKQPSTTAGTGTLTLSGTYTGYQSFSVIGNGNTTYYAIVDSNAGTWEIGVGTYTSAGSTLSRDTVLASSNGGAAVSFSSNSKEVFVTYPAGNAVTTDLTQTLSNKTINATTVTTTGAVGLGTSLVTGTSVRNAINVTGATNANSYSVEATVLSDVTSGARMFLSRPTTQATTFTLSSLVHYYANPQTFGAGSTVTNQFGFHAESSLTGATNNYGFYGNIAAGTGRYNLYMAGTANNYMGGKLGVKDAPFADTSGISVGGSITGGSVTSAVNIYATVQSDVTTNATGYFSQIATAASVFTVGSIQHFKATQLTFGVGSTVTSQYGFIAASTLTGATNNYGFYGDIAAGANRYNLFMNGTANNYMGGKLGVGVIPYAGPMVAAGGNATGGASTSGVSVSQTVQSDSTTSYNAFETYPATQATAFTLTALTHYNAAQSTIGASSTVTNQYGFAAGGSIVGATNNYGFFGNLPAGTNRWNLYMGGTANNYMAGSLGIGGNPAAGTALRVSKNITGSTSGYGVLNDGTIQSDVTSDVAMYRSTPATAAAAFTLGSLFHFQATNNGLGAGSSVSNQFGFHVELNITQATNNYGFYGNIPAGTNRWNLYMNGTANNYVNGRFLIGTTSNNNGKVELGGDYPTSSSTAYGIVNYMNVPSAVTGSVFINSTNPTTAASAFTLTNLQHYRAAQNTFGAGSTVTNQYGFFVANSLTGATNNYGFYGDIAAGTGRYNLYMAGTADNYLAGNLGIGSTDLPSTHLHIQKALSGASNSRGVWHNATIQSDVAASAALFQTSAATAAAAFTLASLRHFYATQGTIGAGSAVTNQFGFFAQSTLTGASNNYGFYGAIAAGTGRYNLYMAGTADNYLAGSLGVGALPTDYSLVVSKSPVASGGVAVAVMTDATFQSDATGSATSFRSYPSTQAAAYTVTDLYHFQATINTIGAGSTVTNQTAFIAMPVLTGATNNYGFRGRIPAGTGRYNLYMQGTAANYFAGDMQFDKTITAGGTTGAQTIDKNAGSVNFAAAATSLVVTDSRVTTSSVIIATVATNDSTMKSVAVVAAAGSFTLYANAAATAETRVNFIIIN